MKLMTALILSILFLSSSLLCAENNIPPYKNPELPVETRLQDLMSRMTLEEKAAQINLWPNLAEPLKNDSIEEDISQTLGNITHGIGCLQYKPSLPPEDFA